MRVCAFVVNLASRIQATMPEPDFDWLLRARSEIQSELHLLWVFGRDQRNALLAAADDATRTTFTLLIGAGFSLWRAAFLSDISRSWPEIIDKGNDLLKTVLITNAVPFSTDRAVRDWMMGYYLNNARFRLATARDRLAVPAETQVWKDFGTIHPRGIEDVNISPTRIWDILLPAFCDLRSTLKNRVASETVERPARDEMEEQMKSGDVLIRRKPGTSLCVYGVVLDDGAEPAYWRAGTLAEAKAWAKTITAETGGKTQEEDLQKHG
jgi:hypothetical protein